jgi:hypothetical protein
LASLTALFIDESAFFLNGQKKKYKDNYLIWVPASIAAAAVATAIMMFVSKNAIGSGIP